MALVPSDHLSDGNFVGPAAHLLSSFLEPDDWLSVRRINSIGREALCHTALQLSIVDVLKQIVVRFSTVENPGEDDFSRLAHALRIVVFQKPRDKSVQNVLGELLECFNAWFGKGPRVSAISDEVRKPHNSRRVLLRNMEPKLWTAAMRAYPVLAPRFFDVLCRWPLSYSDRDHLLEKVDGASLLALADFDDPKSISGACKFACKLSCGSEGRVDRVEREHFSTRATEALRRHNTDEDVAIHALGYLNNVSHCPEHWPTLSRLGLAPLCRNSLPHDLEDHEFVHNILEAVQ